MDVGLIINSDLNNGLLWSVRQQVNIWWSALSCLHQTKCIVAINICPFSPGQNDKDGIPWKYAMKYISSYVLNEEGWYVVMPRYSIYLHFKLEIIGIGYKKDIFTVGSDIRTVSQLPLALFQCILRKKVYFNT